MGLREFTRDQPVLAGCLGLLGCGSLLGVVALLTLAVAGKGCWDAAQDSIGLDSMISAVQDAAAAGFALSVSVDNGATTYTLTPLELDAPQAARAVDCDQLYRLLDPHLTGTRDEVLARSWAIVEGEGGLQPAPVECRWTGLSQRLTR